MHVGQAALNCSKRPLFSIKGQLGINTPKRLDVLMGDGGMMGKEQLEERNRVKAAEVEKRRAEAQQDGAGKGWEGG